MKRTRHTPEQIVNKLREAAGCGSVQMQSRAQAESPALEPDNADHALPKAEEEQGSGVSGRGILDRGADNLVKQTESTPE